MKRLIWIVVAAPLLFMLNSCATTTIENIERITIGMDKATVLDIAGDPDKTFRQNNKDYWTYKYYENDELKEGQIILKNGRVTFVLAQVNSPEPPPKDFKEYKKEVKENRNSYEKQFKNLGD